MRSSLSKLLPAYTAGNASGSSNKVCSIAGWQSFGRVARCAEQYRRGARALPPPFRRARVPRIADWQAALRAWLLQPQVFLFLCSSAVVLERNRSSPPAEQLLPRRPPVLPAPKRAALRVDY